MMTTCSPSQHSACRRAWEVCRARCVLLRWGLLVYALCISYAGAQSIESADSRQDSARVSGPGATSAEVRGGEGLEVFSRQMSFQDETQDDKLLIVSEEGYLDYDQDREVIYANKRTEISYKGMTLAADMMHIDVRLREVTASGNVTLKGNGAELQADQILYNLREEAGEAQGVAGSISVLHLYRGEGKEARGATFQRLGTNESRVTGANITTCDFKKPMYYISAREVLVEEGERVFLKGATVYVHDVPVFYLPVFSQSLKKGSPWSIFLGYKSDIGAWARLRYTYEHQRQEPDPLNGDTMEIVGEGKLMAFIDYISRHGPGAGIDYRYDFGKGRHRGHAKLYFLQGGDRDTGADQSYEYSRYTRTPGGTLLKVAGSERTERYEDDDGLGRYQADIQHRSELTRNITWLVNTDWHSDPELYDEVLDLFENVKRRRVMTRRARTALTWTREQVVARLLLEVKDRIGRDRLTDYSDPADRNRDYDEQPELDKDDREAEAIPTSRWGTASIRAPQITLSTAWIRLWSLPVYYHTDLNLFNSLDKGLNTVDEDDDAWVQGADWYHALMWRWRFAERFTLMMQLGAGAGLASRSDNDFEYFEGEDRLYPVVLDEPEGGLEFPDPKTWLIGDERFSYEDVSTGFAYADALIRLNARLTNALTGDLIYRYRYTTEDFLGDWYAQMGNHHVRSDLYDFRLRENNVEGRLQYDLARPRLSLGAMTWRNLVGRGELFPNEAISRNYLWGSWSSLDQTLLVSGWGGVSERQIYHPSDSRAFVDSSFDVSASLNYRPLSKRWWTTWKAGYEEELDQAVGDEDKDRFREDESRFTVDGLLGARIGPKWTAELTGQYDSRYGALRRAGLNLNRDFHDVMLMLMLGFEKKHYDDEDEDDEGGLAQSLDLRFALQPKLPGGGEIKGVPAITTLEGNARPAEVSRY